MGLRERAIKATAWAGAAKVVGQAVAWAVTLVLARILDPKDYGLMAIVVFFMTFGVFFVRYGAGTAIIQRQTVSDDELSSVFWFTMILALILYAIIYVAAPFIAAYYEMPELTPMLRVVGVAFLFDGAGLVSKSVLEKSLNFRYLAHAEVVATILSAVAAFACAISGLGVWSLVISYLVLSFVRSLLQFVFTRWLPGLKLQVRRILDMITFGSSMSISQVLWYLYAHIDTMLIGKVLGQTPLGFYTMSMSLAAAPLQKVGLVFCQVSLPVLAQVKQDKAALGNYFIKMVQGISLMTLPLYTGGILVANELVPLALGDKWAPAIPAFKVLCLVLMIRAVDTLSRPVLLAVGKAPLALLFDLIFAIVFPVLLLAGLLKGGMTGLFIVMPILYLVSTILWAWIAIRQTDLRLRDFARALWPVIEPCLVMAAVLIPARLLLLSTVKLPYCEMAGAVLPGKLLLVNKLFQAAQLTWLCALGAGAFFATMLRHHPELLARTISQVKAIRSKS